MYFLCGLLCAVFHLWLPGVLSCVAAGRVAGCDTGDGFCASGPHHVMLPPPWGIQLSLLIWNVRGLNDSVKRSTNTILKYLKLHFPDIVPLQETDLTVSMVLMLKKGWVGWSYHSTYSQYSRGASVLIRLTGSFTLLRVQTDPNGKFVFLCCLIHSRPRNILAVYVPPPFDYSVLHKAAQFVLLFPSAPSIWIDDLNHLTTLPPGCQMAAARWL